MYVYLPHSHTLSVGGACLKQAQECFKFLREQASSSAFSAPLALNYIQVIQSCLKLQEFDAKEIAKLEEELKTSEDNLNEMLLKILSRDPSIE